MSITMNTLRNPQPKEPARAGRAALAALLSAVLGLSSCHNGSDGDGTGPGGPVVSDVSVQAVAPVSGPAIGGTLVQVTGDRFLVGEEQRVTLGGQPATDVIVIDEHTLTCRTPPGTAGATVDLKVRNRLGLGQLTAAFTYQASPLATSDVNGDGIADLVVGAPGDDVTGADSGAVYVFFGSADPQALAHKTTAQADLVLMGHHAGDGFGTDVTIGDVTGDHNADLVVGAVGVDLATATDAGAAYVFRGPIAAVGSLSALAANVRLTGESLVPGDRFGSRLEIGDVDTDGTPDLMVAAAGHDAPGKLDAGCVYLFRGGPLLVTKGADQADMGFDGDGANERVASRITCGDLNGDGHADLVVCSPLADPQTPYFLSNAGKVYVVFGGSALAGTGLGGASVTLRGSAAEDRFGTSAAVADLNGDGTADLVVGAPLADGIDYDVGKTYVFFGGPSFASREADLADVILSGQPTHNSLGKTVRAGDVDGDGVADLLIGAPEADYLNDDNGRAYLFLGGPGLASRVAVQADAIFNGESSQGSGLGSSVSLVDYNGDGRAEVVCGASAHQFGAGRLYLWLATAGAPLGMHLAAQADVHFNGLESGAGFGASIAEGH